MEGNDSSKNPIDWKANELGPYDHETYTPGQPYVAAALTTFFPKFVVGDGKKYSILRQTRRNVASVTYTNVPLKSNTTYMVFSRAFISEVS